MRGRTLVQFLNAVELLSRPSGATIESLGKRLAVDRRAVYRMLDAIAELGFPVYDTRNPRERKKCWRLQEDYVRRLPNLALPEFRLTPSELVAVFLLRCGSGILKGSGIERHMDSAFSKLASLLPKDMALGRLEALRGLFVSSSKSVKDLAKSGPIIESLTFAVLRGVTCRLCYHSYSDGATKTFLANPLHLFERSGGLYLLVGRAGRTDVRTLAVERIRSVELTSSPFDYPEGFDADEYLDSVFDVVDGDPVTVAIRFSPQQAPYIRERKWSSGQSITDRPDGSIILRMRVLGLWDVARWVLSHGPSAEVISPASLRKRVAQQAQETASLYQR